MKNIIRITILSAILGAILISGLSTGFTSLFTLWSVALLALAGLAEIGLHSMKPHHNWHQEALKARTFGATDEPRYRRAA